MRKKIFVTVIIGTFLLTNIASITTFSVAVTKTATTEENKNELSSAPLLADAYDMISSSSCYTSGWIYLSGTQPAGNYRCEYKVDFFPIDSFERLVGYWHVSIFAANVVFFQDSGEFDYTGNNEPDDIHREKTMFIPPGLYQRAVVLHCWISYDRYIGGEYHDHCFDETKLEILIIFPRENRVSQNNAINAPFLNFLQSHPNMFPLFQILFKRFGLQ